MTQKEFIAAVLVPLTVVVFIVWVSTLDKAFGKTISAEINALA
jgi:hypothetical protein